ncbi:hypothetical protein IscW_ISCW013009 [Ixodes scapularis]|uniref:Uncharacterized protein n=1 Tax=Ixodes scapularis TaxID=6945 RepID=B7QGJ4_IXOSC|nr:hypothetical protein IscW_ISCW013009 [Ixodes scapularis]|eukprot:XP_002401825.1 hypothetical protein IscW_ISCW013009 [Ixodes scapularis]
MGYLKKELGHRCSPENKSTSEPMAAVPLGVDPQKLPAYVLAAIKLALAIAMSVAKVKLPICEKLEKCSIKYDAPMILAVA